MKKIRVLLITLIALVLFISCNADTTAANMADKNQNSTGKGKILIVYFSHSGTTKTAAELIQKNVGGDILEIKLADEYPADYGLLTERVQEEQDKHILPALSTKIDNINTYDTIFIGHPIWRGTIPPPVLTFLSEYDLSGKTVVPFYTSESGTFGNSMTELKKLAPNAKVLENLIIQSSNINNADNAIKEWLVKLKML
ncbi:flavodoxin [Sebaldella sp. S0638]|uniref:flavodoxin n=1 Tax=Sebaldella sp. S0638 TaxID=2957809 RepID=UPI00209DC92D|nr:flavodoxin [Sebaldella sp. S0638]MCP1223539.1 flavodoxin [Sebaldella sp. S0638]